MTMCPLKSASPRRRQRRPVCEHSVHDRVESTVNHTLSAYIVQYTIVRVIKLFFV